MIDGYDTYRLYLAFKLHFDSDKYDIFAKNGGVTAKVRTFEQRRDKSLFELLGSKFKEKKILSECLVANIAYGNPGVIYNIPKTLENHKLWIKRKDSITKVFSDDMITFDFGLSSDDILTSPITIESKVILNNITNYTSDIKVNPLITDKIRIIRKLSRFVKYDESKIKMVMQSIIDTEENFKI